MANQFGTPLRYPGGKTKLANFVKLIYQENNLMDGHYLEAYAGGAGVALSLLFHEYVSDIHINDLSRSVFSFWHSVLNETDALCELINQTDVTVDEWYRQKQIQTQAQNFNLLQLGFSTFYLNRTNRSGIVTGGMIGGKEQTGEWKIDARYNKDTLIARIKKIARYRCRIHLYNLDAIEFLTTLLPQLPTNKTFTYLDPPYFVKGQGLYEDYYRPEDHGEVARIVSAIDHHWMVSYDNTPEIAALYDNHRKLEYTLNYSAATSYEGSELIFFSDDLNVPLTGNPTKVYL